MGVAEIVYRATGPFCAVARGGELPAGTLDALVGPDLGAAGNPRREVTPQEKQVVLAVVTNAHEGGADMGLVDSHKRQLRDFGSGTMDHFYCRGAAHEKGRRGG